MDFGDVIKIGIQQGRPVHLIAMGIILSGGREEVAIVIGIQDHGERLLADVVDAGGLAAFFLGF